MPPKKQLSLDADADTLLKRFFPDEPIAVYNTESTVLLAVMVLIKIVQLLMYLYGSHHRGLKKKYNNDNNNSVN